MDEDDPVIKEMDICLDTSMAESDQKLVLLHFPMSPPQEDLSLASAKYKPQLNMLHLEKVIPEDSTNVCPEDDSPGTVLLTSTKSKADQNSLVYCFLKEGRLHWVPFHSVLTMKPSFPHIDALSAPDISSDPDPGEVRAINLRFANSGGRSGYRENSYQHYQQKVSQEPWTQLSIHQGGDFSLLGEDGPREGGLAWDALNVEKALSLNRPASNSPDLNQLMKTQLTRALVVHQEEILDLFSRRGSWSERDVFRSLVQSACLVRSCWVVKSELVYPSKVKSSHQLPHSVLAAARDYILWRFTLSPRLSKKNLLQQILVSKEREDSLPQDILTEVLKTVGRPLERSPDTWALLLPPPPSPLPARSSRLSGSSTGVWNLYHWTTEVSDYTLTTSS